MTPTEILRLAVRLWISENGPEGYDPATNGTGVPFILAAEREYFAELRRVWPTLFVPPASCDNEIRALVHGHLPPDDRGVIYTHIGRDEEILYVGQTLRFAVRQRQHRNTSLWWDEVERIEWFRPTYNLRKAEEERIKLLRPRYNVAHNRD